MSVLGTSVAMLSDFPNLDERDDWYVAETLMPALEELDAAYRKFRDDPDFKREMQYFLQDYLHK